MKALEVQALTVAYSAGMARFTCHNPHNVYDIIPCDLVASSILVACAALQQVRACSGNGRSGMPPACMHARLCRWACMRLWPCRQG